MISSMHIIGSQHSGGAERFFIRLVDGIAATGNPVLTICRKSSSVARDLPCTIEQAHVPMKNFLDVWSRWRISRIVKKLEPHIVQTYMGRATRLTHVPKTSGAVHIARLGGFYKLAGYRHAHAWIGNTKAVCDYLVDNGFPRDRVFYIRNFVEPASGYNVDELANLRKKYGIPVEAKLLVAVGRLVEKKGFQDLLKAFSGLPADIGGAPLYLMVVGDGPMARQLKIQAVSEGVADRVVWPGWQAQPDPFYALADIFVCPSRHEPLGNVILEAWSHSKAVCSTLTHGARELIEHEKNGILVPCEDTGKMTEALRQMLLASESSIRALGDQGFHEIINNFSRDSVVNEYLELYRKLLG